MRSMCILATLCVASATALPAQGTGTTRERIREEVAEKQRLMREGKVMRSNVRVTVRLRNGSRMTGVVKNGRFVENHDGLVFVSADRVAKGSGLRIWYYDSTNSFVFLPWESIAEHSIGEVLSDVQVAQMGLEFDRRSKEAQDRQAAARKGSGEKGRGGPDPADVPKHGPTKESATQPATAGLTPAEAALLAEFPPTEGWGLERLQELEARKIRIGVYPNKKEQRFIDNFSAWNEANQKQREHDAAQQAQRGGLPPPAAKSGPDKPATPPKGSDPAARPGK